MTKPMIRIHNSQTDEIIDREMTNDEFDVYKKQEEIRLAEIELRAQAELAKETAQSKLAALGLTTDDLKALGL